LFVSFCFFCIITTKKTTTKHNKKQWSATPNLFQYDCTTEIY